jgi:phosphatidylglycerol---prolipoprotein diacylglyceryl transferase
MSSHYIVDFDPIIISLGPLQVRWYGLMYVVGFVLSGFILKILSKKKFFTPGIDKIDSLITHMLIGMFLGARIFYVFIYNWDYYSQHFGDLFAVWKGGLSFHGAIIGLLVGGYLFARKNKVAWAEVLDNSCLAGTWALFFGRIGNFINGELYGRTTDSAFGMIFHGAGPYPRHPSQLYEGISEGLILGVILWLIYPRVKSYGFISSFFLIGYGIFRFIVEFFREADAQLGYYGIFTMGQILCFIMILVGLVGLYYSNKRLWPVKVASEA